MEENSIQLEEKSQEDSPVTPSDMEHVHNGKGKRKRKSLITTKKWIQIATQRPKKQHGSDCIHGKPTIISSKGKTKFISPVVTSEGKFPKASEKSLVQRTVKGKNPKKRSFLLIADTNIMSPVHLRDLEVPMNKPEERTGLFRARRSGFG
ncbi:hypothetical protein O181_002601 [Austropuccinia psidii MF-1]|uniref:Uncharacterized protein n=1 Tax=Austropuccinia psidii MF-1 TaxID=1389203 RepID=A0A9Q3BC76_9BASI|nr:hypothetical protein [Austropuccinia psidii MF-1]